jgi:hypothetical protein
MSFDLLEPILNSTYLFLGIVGVIVTFSGWLYNLQKKKRDDDKAELIDYVDKKFKTVTAIIENTNNTTNTKLDSSLELLRKILNYETKNIKLHIRNLSITDDRLENDIARIEGIVLFKKEPDPREYYQGKTNTKTNKKSNIPYNNSENMEDETNGF